MPMYIKQNNTMILVGPVLREAKLRQTRNGKYVASFYMQYGFHHDADGNSVKDCIDVSVWGKNAQYIGDEDVGIAKGDTVLVVGYLVNDDYHTEKDGEQKYKLTADLVIDMTSFFQVAQMVVNGPPAPVEEQPRPQPTLSSGFTDFDADEGNPFLTEDDELQELPY